MTGKMIILGLARKCLSGKALAAVALQKPAASALPLTLWDRFNYYGPEPSSVAYWPFGR